jgi:hypothetical protein
MSTDFNPSEQPRPGSNSNERFESNPYTGGQPTSPAPVGHAPINPPGNGGGTQNSNGDQSGHNPLGR